MTLNSMPVIVCETEGRWAAMLRRELPLGVSLVETRTLQSLWERLEESPGAIVALELTTENREKIVSALVRIGQEFPHAVAVVLADRASANWEEVVREAGAVHFIVSTRRVNELGKIVRRWRENIHA